MSAVPHRGEVWLPWPPRGCQVEPPLRLFRLTIREPVTLVDALRAAGARDFPDNPATLADFDYTTTQQLATA